MEVYAAHDVFSICWWQGAWRFFDGDGWLRWLIASVVLGGCYALLGRTLMRRQNFGPRSYRYAE